jgi:hypothetical protein
MGKTVLACAACLAAMAAFFAAPAHADTTDDLLKSLKDKGILTEQEYETLAKRQADEEAMHIATPSVSHIPARDHLRRRCHQCAFWFLACSVMTHCRDKDSVNPWYLGAAISGPR